MSEDIPVIHQTKGYMYKTKSENETTLSGNASRIGLSCAAINAGGECFIPYLLRNLILLCLL